MAHSAAQLGGYAVLERIGCGGMAELFLGRREQRTFAIKRVLPDLLAQREYVHMFQDEARLAALLAHPNLVCACETGEDQGAPYYVMEYVHGRDVRKLLRAAVRGGGIPLGVALAIVAGAARGLHFAHELRDDEGQLLGVVHRDISPSNVIVAFDGCPRVLDFGVAKAARRMSETRTGVLKGKTAYMSPEQCMGQAVDRRSDVFALGVLLFELTTGTRLYRATNDFELLALAARAEVPAPSSRRPDYPAALEAIVLGALARAPEDRPATAALLANQIEAYGAEHGFDLSARAVAACMARLFPGEATPAHGWAALEPEAVAATTVDSPQALQLGSGSHSKSISLLDHDSVAHALAALDDAETLCVQRKAAFPNTLVVAVVPPAPPLARGTMPPISLPAPRGAVALFEADGFAHGAPSKRTRLERVNPPVVARPRRRWRGVLVAALCLLLGGAAIALRADHGALANASTVAAPSGR